MSARVWRRRRSYVWVHARPGWRLRSPQELWPKTHTRHMGNREFRRVLDAVTRRHGHVLAAIEDPR